MSTLERNASIVIVTYNHEKYIKKCILSIVRSSSPKEIIVVDNNSQDSTVKILASLTKKYPFIRVIRNKKNVGFGTANNIGVRKTKGEYIIFLNPDTYVTRGWLKKLLEPFKHADRLVTTPKILTFEGKINTCGLLLHFTGLGFVRGWLEDPQKFNEREFLHGVSGACFAIRKEDYIRLGGFDESFFVYMDDVEFSWRLSAKGFRILLVPSSIVYHDYSLKTSPQKIYYLEKGRYIILRKYFDKTWLLFFLPSLLVTEILSFGYCFLNGRDYVYFKLKALRDGLRAEVNKVKCSRKKLLKSMVWKIPNEFFGKSVTSVVEPIANFIYLMNYLLSKII